MGGRFSNQTGKGEQFHPTIPTVSAKVEYEEVKRAAEETGSFQLPLLGDSVEVSVEPKDGIDERADAESLEEVEQAGVEPSASVVYEGTITEREGESSVVLAINDDLLLGYVSVSEGVLGIRPKHHFDERADDAEVLVYRAEAPIQPIVCGTARRYEPEASLRDNIGEGVLLGGANVARTGLTKLGPVSLPKDPYGPFGFPHPQGRREPTPPPEPRDPPGPLMNELRVLPVIDSSFENYVNARFGKDEDFPQVIAMVILTFVSAIYENQLGVTITPLTPAFIDTSDLSDGTTGGTMIGRLRNAVLSSRDLLKPENRDATGVEIVHLFTGTRIVDQFDDTLFGQADKCPGAYSFTSFGSGVATDPILYGMLIAAHEIGHNVNGHHKFATSWGFIFNFLSIMSRVSDHLKLANIVAPIPATDLNFSRTNKRTIDHHLRRRRGRDLSKTGRCL